MTFRSSGARCIPTVVGGYWVQKDASVDRHGAEDRQRVAAAVIYRAHHDGVKQLHRACGRVTVHIAGDGFTGAVRHSARTPPWLER
jgi:hypothetical protein